MSKVMVPFLRSESSRIRRFQPPYDESCFPLLRGESRYLYVLYGFSRYSPFYRYEVSPRGRVLGTYRDQAKQ